MPVTLLALAPVAAHSAGVAPLGWNSCKLEGMSVLFALTSHPCTFAPTQVGNMPKFCPALQPQPPPQPHHRNAEFHLSVVALAPAKFGHNLVLLPCASKGVYHPAGAALQDCPSQKCAAAHRCDQDSRPRHLRCHWMSLPLRVRCTLLLPAGLRCYAGCCPCHPECCTGRVSCCA